MLSLKSTLIVPMLLAIAGPCAAGTTQHAKIALGTKALSGGKIALSFTVEPDPGIILNDEGPWKLEITKHDGLDLASTSLGKPQFKGDHFEVEAKTKQAKGEVSYKMVTYVCTQAHTQCYREVHAETAPWTAPKA